MSSKIVVQTQLNHTFGHFSHMAGTRIEKKPAGVQASLSWLKN
jgi:hypothetical protein